MIMIQIRVCLLLRLNDPPESHVESRSCLLKWSELGVTVSTSKSDVMDFLHDIRTQNHRQVCSCFIPRPTEEDEYKPVTPEQSEYTAGGGAGYESVSFFKPQEGKKTFLRAVIHLVAP